MSNIKIIQFQGTKVKRLEAVNITFKEDGTTIIGGANAQGKTSVLDIIMSLVKGTKYKPSDPIKDGAEVGEAKITLNNGVVIHRKFNGNRSTLKVSGCTGQEQTFLNELFGEHALDVREFMSAKDKSKILMKICGLDFTDIDAEYKRLYDERTLANREEARVRSHVASLHRYDNVPDEEVNTAELLANVREIERERSAKVTAYDRATSQYNVNADSVVELSDERDRLMKRLKQLDEKEIPEAKARANSCKEESARLRKDIESADYDDQIELIEGKIANAEETNTKIRANKEYYAAFQRQEDAICEAARLDEDVKSNREQKKRMLQETRFPLAGLTIHEGEMRYKDRAWDGLSTAEQFMVATSIQAALKPDAPIVLLDHMEAFDEKTLSKFSQWCEQKGYQVIGTRVSTGNECDVIIHDGTVQEEE